MMHGSTRAQSRTEAYDQLGRQHHRIDSFSHTARYWQARAGSIFLDAVIVPTLFAHALNFS